MQTLFSSLVKRLHKVYRKAEAFIEEERDFTLSQTFLNATLERYVTNNVEFLDDLHADLYHDWLRLYATMHVKGLETTLSVDLKLIQMEFNKEQQLIIFEQISNTQIVEAKYKNFWQKIAVKAAIFYYHKILKKDPLGMILERFNVAQEKDDLIFLDLNRWFGKKASIIETLGKVHINYARVREAELVVFGNVNLAALLFRDQDDDFEDDLEDTEITPIQQKDA
ncbi:hypothetical protein RMA95_00340 [Acinetobacter sp. V110_1]|uniref:hypothetical protein n=1 Tax=Acinetobacter sp. V110_1 TaxID=3072988 RepID=UPI00287F36FE|nr:hypothetical protein [Acinetobacter sp. V110_1]MDS7942372.1 hypothetical protein [Acinetobacter sp. V110_1]